MGARLADEADIFPLTVVLQPSEIFAGENIGETEDGIERRAQFMADGSEETRLGVIGGFRLGCLAGDIAAQTLHLGNIGELGDDAAQATCRAANGGHLDTGVHELRLARFRTGLEAEFGGCPLLTLPQDVESLHQFDT